ncbi:MAG: DUF1376 domain-containing protein [Pseudomonadota bacterium]
MNWYKKHIGDYMRKAGRLSMVQHGAYNLLMDSCYDREDFPTRDDAIEWTWASTTEEVEAVEFVLGRFFTLGQDGKYVQKHIAEDIAEYRGTCQKNAENGKKGGRPKKANRAKKKPKQNPVGFSDKPVGSDPPPEKSLTKNQEPETTNQEPGEPEHPPDGVWPPPAIGVGDSSADHGAPGEVRPIPADFALTTDMRDWARTNGLEHIDLTVATREFVDYWRKRGDAKPDWIQKWRDDMFKKAEIGWGHKVVGMNSPQRTRDRTIEQDLTDTSWAEREG